MALLIYFIVFLATLAYRAREVAGYDMNPQIDSLGRPFFEKRMNFNGKIAGAIGIDLAADVHFTIVRERWVHRLLKYVTLSKEIRHEDWHIDELLFVSDLPDHFTRLLQSARFKNALKTIFSDPQKYGRKAHRLTVSGGKIWIQTGHFQKQVYEEHAQPVYLACLHDMAAVIESLAKEGAFKTTLRRHPLALRYMAIASVNAALLYAALTRYLPLPNSIDVLAEPLAFDRAIPWILTALCLVMTTLIFLLLRRSMWLVAGIWDFILFGIIGIWLGMPGLIQEVNIRFDFRAPVTQEMTVVDKSCTLYCVSKTQKGFYYSRERDYTSMPCHISKRSITIMNSEHTKRPGKCKAGIFFTYALNMLPENAKKNASPTLLPVTEEAFDGIPIQSTIDVTTYPGFLGFPWLNPNDAKVVSLFDDDTEKEKTE